jgi:hypothetical protein
MRRTSGQTALMEGTGTVSRSFWTTLISLGLASSLATPAKGDIELSGPLAGTLRPGLYHVVDNVWVAPGDTLRILPPADLRFDHGTNLEVNGRLTAPGVPGDSIRFLPWGTTWNGLVLTDAEGRSRLAYCRISGAALGGIFCNNSALDLSNVDLAANTGTLGGGVRANLADLVVVDCRIRSNVATHLSGCGGVHLSGSVAVFDGCEIRDNQATGSGAKGGLYASGTEIRMRDCEVSDNTGGGGGGGLHLVGCTRPLLEKCEIRGNAASGAGGIDIINCAGVVLLECVVLGNRSFLGGGIRCERSTLALTRCQVARNECLSHYQSPGVGGGICAYDDSRLTLIQCTVTANLAYPWDGLPPQGDGIYAGYMAAVAPNLELRGCIVAGNEGGGGGVFFAGPSVAPRITYGDFWGNQGGEFTGYPVDPQLGLVTGFNANGDPCDVYFNISADPAFADPLDGDYHLTAESACIDAGDPADPLDPDGTVADQGVYWFDQTPSTVQNLPVESGAVLWLARPNPLSSRTSLSFLLTRPSVVRLEVFDVTGGRVRELLSAALPAGPQSATWDGCDQAGHPVAAGSYLCRLRADRATCAMRLILVK